MSAVVAELDRVTVPTRRDAEAPSLTEVTWTVREGEFWVVGGLQGAGKSDLMFMLAGLTRPLAGHYLLLGQDMARRFGDEFLPNRLRVGMVFDDARLLNHLTLAENVALPVRYHQNVHAADAAGWVEALMRATDVLDFADNTPGAVARHWRRRAALARALAMKPDVLLLENPLRGLDARHTAWWVDFVTQLWRGHHLLGGKQLTIAASADEFRPWRSTGAQFAMLHARQFQVLGAAAPEDDTRMVAGSGGGI